MEFGTIGTLSLARDQLRPGFSVAGVPIQHRHPLGTIGTQTHREIGTPRRLKGTPGTGIGTQFGMDVRRVRAQRRLNRRQGCRWCRCFDRNLVPRDPPRLASADLSGLNYETAVRQAGGEPAQLSRQGIGALRPQTTVAQLVVRSRVERLEEFRSGTVKWALSG